MWGKNNSCKAFASGKKKSCRQVGLKNNFRAPKMPPLPPHPGYFWWSVPELKRYKCKQGKWRCWRWFFPLARADNKILARPLVCFKTTTKRQQTLVTNSLKSSAVRVKGWQAKEKKSWSKNWNDKRKIAKLKAVDPAKDKQWEYLRQAKGNCPDTCGQGAGTPVIKHICFFLFYVRLQERFFSSSLPKSHIIIFSTTHDPFLR